MAGMTVGEEQGPEEVTCIVDGCDNRRGGEGRKELRVYFFFLSFFYFLPGVSRFGCGLRASGSMRVSIARILSSISDNRHDGVIDQWDGGEGLQRGSKNKWMTEREKKSDGGRGRLQPGLRNTPFFMCLMIKEPANICFLFHVLIDLSHLGCLIHTHTHRSITKAKLLCNPDDWM